jgi:hypothetical protein
VLVLSIRKFEDDIRKYEERLIDVLSLFDGVRTTFREPFRACKIHQIKDRVLCSITQMEFFVGVILARSNQTYTSSSANIFSNRPSFFRSILKQDTENCMRPRRMIMHICLSIMPASFTKIQNPICVI